MKRQNIETESKKERYEESEEDFVFSWNEDAILLVKIVTILPVRANLLYVGCRRKSKS